MNFQAAITTDLINSIASKCKISTARAAAELKIAKRTAKATGLTVAEVLTIMGLV